MSESAKYRILLQNLKGLLLLLTVILTVETTAQTLPTRHYTVRDGLPDRAIQAIYKDSRGLLWIGTQAGLCTFDGKSFRIFTPFEGMTANQVWAIAEDDNGIMWFGSYGEGIYNYDGRQFRRFTRNDGLADDRIRVLCWSKNFRCLIAGSHEGISVIRDSGISNFPGKMFSEHFNCVTGLVDAGDFIYILTHGESSPIRYYPDKNQFVNAFDGGEHYPVDSYSGFLTSDGDTIFSMGTKGVRIFNRKSIVENDTLGQVFGMAEDKQGAIWLAAWSFYTLKLEGGIFRYDGKTFRNYKDAFGISDREIWTVFCDKEQDILWIGTINEGLFMVPGSGISTYAASYFNLEQLKINDLYIDSQEKLWISDDHELIRMEPDGSYSLTEKHPMVLTYREFWKNTRPDIWSTSGSIRQEARKLVRSQLPEFEKQTAFRFRKVVETDDHSFIVANELGLFCLDESCQHASYLDTEGSTYEFAVAGTDTLILSGWEYTALNPDYRAPWSGNHLTPVNLRPSYKYFLSDHGPKNVSRLVKEGIRCWYTSSTSGLWMSEGDRMVNLNQSDTTISEHLNDLCFDEKGRLIFGSNQGEICIATLQKDSLRIDHRIGRDQGLQGNTISWLIADKKGLLWAGTNLGLNCIDLDSLYIKQKVVIRFMNEEEGYSGQSSKRAVIDRKGNLWIAAEDILIKLDTRTFFPRAANPITLGEGGGPYESGPGDWVPLAGEPVPGIREKNKSGLITQKQEITEGRIVLKSLEINNEPADSLLAVWTGPWKSIPAGRITFKHFENDLIFHFDILNYLNPGKDRFRFMLRGYDENWHLWDAGRKAVYTNLPPGRYTFSVESKNLNTLLPAEPLNIDFIVRHPWWRLWYMNLVAILLVLLLSGLSTLGYLRSARKRQEMKSEVEKKIARLEMQALQAQMNPHFIFNCVNGIQYYVLANKMDEVLVYLNDFSRVVGESLANATRQMVPVEQVTGFLESYLRLEQMRFPEKFDFEIRVAGRMGDGVLLMPPMMIQPFAENAIRHGFTSLSRKGFLSVVLEKTGGDVIKCTITDNGVGRSMAAERKNGNEDAGTRPHSAAITEARIRLFNPPGEPEKYRIVYTDLFEREIACGLKVELYLPAETGMQT